MEGTSNSSALRLQDARPSHRRHRIYRREAAPTLLEAGHDVRCLARDPKKLQDPRRDQVEVVRGDVLDSATLGPALAECDAAYYLVLSMGNRDRDFHDLDREAARNFRVAATKARLERIYADVPACWTDAAASPAAAQPSDPDWAGRETLTYRATRAGS